MSTISSVSSSTLMQSMQSARSAKRPDPKEMAENLFSQLDTSGQGYLQKADLQAAYDKISSASSSSSSSSSTSSVDDLFSKLDSDSDGKITKQEFSDALSKVTEQLDNQFMSMRMNGGMEGMGGGGMGGGMSGMGGGMPPPPPPGDGQGSDSGFTKDELTSQLSEIGSSDSKRSSLISNVVNNFDKADTDGDGKVSFKEAMAFDQSSSASSSSTSSSSSTASTSDTSSTSSSSSDLDAKVMLQIMRLMHAYSMGTDSSASSSLSVSA